MASKSARAVVTRSPKRKVGRVNCRWFQTSPIEHESQLEKKFILRAILCPHLVGVLHQPFKLKLEPPNSVYTPDFRLTFRNGQSLIVEVKTERMIKQIIPRLDAISRKLATDGTDFLVVHERQISGGDRLARARIVRRYANVLVPDALRATATAVLRPSPAITIAQLKQATGISFPQICALVACHAIALGPDLALSDNDVVCPIPLEPQDAPTQFGIWFGASAWRKNY